MFPDICKPLFPLINNYPIRVLEASALSDAELAGMTSSLREVMTYIKYSESKEGLRKVLDVENEHFRHLDVDAARVICAVTGSNMPIDEAEEGIDMCKAIQDMIQEAEAKGNAKTEAKVNSDNIHSSISVYRENGMSEDTILNLLERIFKLTAQDARKYLAEW